MDADTAVTILNVANFIGLCIAVLVMLKKL